MMDAVEAIEAKVLRTEAEKAATQVVTDIAKKFRCDDAWIDAWVGDFRRALIGDGQKPRLTAHQIRQAYGEVIDGWKSRTPPNPAHLLERGHQYQERPKPKRTEPAETKPERVFTDAQRKANKERIAELNRRTFQNMEKIRKASHQYGYGSPEAIRIADECHEQLQAWIDDQARAMRAEGL